METERSSVTILEEDEPEIYRIYDRWEVGMSEETGLDAHDPLAVLSGAIMFTFLIFCIIML